MIELWDFQAVLVERVRDAIRRGYRRILLVSPTGSGKTVMFAFLVSRMASKNVRSTILAHRQELVEQVSNTLTKFSARHGFICAGEYYDPRRLVHVGSVFTAARRLDKLEAPQYGIVDEAHHAIEGSTWGNCMKHWPNAIWIGVTATPERLSGEGLSDSFDILIEGPTTRELIDKGYLAKYKMFAPAKKFDTSALHMQGGDYNRKETDQLMRTKRTITGDAVEHYVKYLRGAPAVAFCVSVGHAQDVAEMFRARGFKSTSIDGKMAKKERREITRDFASGRINVLTSCDLISEGYDQPGIHGAIFLRPTESLALYLQQCGRTLRTFPGKEHAFILDHVGNSARHGLPTDDRVWTLEGHKRKKRRDPDDIAIRQCMYCGAVMAATATECDECGREFPIKERTIEYEDGELSEIDVNSPEGFRLARQRAKDLEALELVGKMRGMRYPRKWAAHVINAREAKRRKVA